MPDRRYRERNYTAEMHQFDHGVYLNLSRNDKQVAEVAIVFTGGKGTPLQLTLKQGYPLEHTMTIDLSV